MWSFLLMVTGLLYIMKYLSKRRVKFCVIKVFNIDVAFLGIQFQQLCKIKI